MTSGDAWEFWGKAAGEEPPKTGLLSRAARGIATLLLAGLTSIEVLVLALAFTAAVGFLWLSDAVTPDRLVTDVWIRSGWAVTVLSIVRPITWVPYWLLFLGFQAMVDVVAPGRTDLSRNLVANLGALAVLAGVTALVFAAIPGSSTDVLSFLGFLTGTVTPEDLGRVAGEWDALRTGAVVGGVLLLRIVLPPLGRDLDLSGEPILGLVSGGRGRFDRVVLIAVLIAAVALVGTGLALRGLR